MRSDWILDVLADLKTFALSNNLPQLAEHLDDTAIVALAEIAARDERAQGATHGKTGSVGTDLGGFGAS